MNNDIEIQAQNYTNKVQLLENHFLRFYRSHQWQVPSVQLDVFSRYWSLAFINGHQSKVLIEREGNKIPLRGHQCIFIPQFSLIKWHILSHELNWIGYFSDLPLLNFSVNEAIAFPYTGELPQIARR